MKTITATELKSILASHKLWLDGNGGICADLKDANLINADLEGADLTGANLYNADLRGAYLRDANLIGADLTDADLTDADLMGANLTGTILDKKVEKKAEKVEKKAEVASINAESTIRSEIEAIAKKHGMKVDSITLSFL